MKILCTILVLSTLKVFWQTSITPEQRQQANKFYIAADWNESRKAYHVIVQAEPQNWNAKMRLGVSMTQIGNPKEAFPLFGRSG